MLQQDELADELLELRLEWNAAITTDELYKLNRCLDDAVAIAVRLAGSTGTALGRSLLSERHLVDGLLADVDGAPLALGEIAKPQNVLNISMTGVTSQPGATRNGRDTRQSNVKNSLSFRALLRPRSLPF